MYKTVILAVALIAACDSASACIRDGYYLGGGLCDSPRVIAVPGPQFQGHYRQHEWYRHEEESRGIIGYVCRRNDTGEIVHEGPCTGDE